MHLAHYSSFVLVLLIFIVKNVQAIRGCVVTLINPTSTKRRVLCGDPKSLIKSIPRGLSTNTDMLIINSQNITYIRENDFNHIMKLSTLSVTYSNLERIHKNAFQYLSQLNILDLSGNRLTISETSLPKDLMLHLRNLQHLKLTNNPLNFIPDFFFKPLSNLRKLFINDCGFVSLRISSNAFSGLHFIEEIDMRNSGIEKLYKVMESDLREMKSLKILLLDENPWVCDCELRWLYFYLISLQDIIKFRSDDMKGPRCKTPTRLANSQIPALDDRAQLKYNDFVCPANCSRLSLETQTIKSGNSVNLTCKCFSDPIKQVRWTKNGYHVEETLNKFRIYQSGKEHFQSTLHISTLQSMDSGNWSCRLEDIVKNFTIKINFHSPFSFSASLNVYLFVGLGSSVLLISLIIVMIVMFCKRDLFCQYQNQNPMVICGYETQNRRKPSDFGGHIQFNNPEQDSKFYCNFYDNTMPINVDLSPYQRTNFDQNGFLMEKAQLPNTVLNKNFDNQIYNIFNSNNDPNQDIMSNSVNSNFQSTKSCLKPSRPNYDTSSLHTKSTYQSLLRKNSSEKEKMIPKIHSNCLFGGSSATLTRIPGDKPCPVHGSTSTLPSRLTSKKIEHRSNCRKHDKDTSSVKSLKLENTYPRKIQPHRSKIVNKISSNPNDVEIITPVGYRPCPLHGDILAEITKNIIYPSSNSAKSQKMESKNKLLHSTESSLRIPRAEVNELKRRSKESISPSDLQTASSTNTFSSKITSPVQSSLSSSPLLASDVHGTVV